MHFTPIDTITSHPARRHHAGRIERLPVAARSPQLSRSELRRIVADLLG